MVAAGCVGDSLSFLAFRVTRTMMDMKKKWRNARGSSAFVNACRIEKWKTKFPAGVHRWRKSIFFLYFVSCRLEISNSYCLFFISLFSFSWMLTKSLLTVTIWRTKKKCKKCYNNSVLGMYLFGGKFCMRDDGSRPCTCSEILAADPGCLCDRKHFNTLLWATVTVFQASSRETRRLFFLVWLEKTTFKKTKLN